MTTFNRAAIKSVGISVPKTIMTNKEFEKFLDTTDEWITTRTGIRQRHIVQKDENITAADLGADAISIALKKANLEPSCLDGIICATFTPDYFFPSTACRIQAKIGSKKSFGFDISAACAGFVYALNVAQGLISSGQAETIAVVGSEITSRSLDWTDRGTCILFGDGAGAVILQKTDKSDLGILATHMASDGTIGDILTLPAWGEKRTMTMKGNEVFKHAVRMMSDASINVLSQVGLTLDDIDLFIPHQANIRIIQAVGEHLNLPQSKVISNVAMYGNTSAASIPIAMNEAWEAGQINPGTTAVLTSLGGGIAVASAVVRF